MRVVLIEDHDAVRFALAATVRSLGLGEVVGEAASACEGLALVRELCPDLSVLDLRLAEETTGVEVCRELKGLPETPRVLVYTSYRRAADLYLCRAAGADGYVNKSAPLDELSRAIHRVAAGESVWPDDMTAPDVHAFVNHKTLTVREREVFELALRGYGNARIAKELHISLPTVKSHIGNILRKLGLKRRSEIPTSRLWEEE